MKRILIVEDKEENRYYLDALLTGHGYTVETARHGAEALFKARQNPPSLIIADLLMPVMDGYTLLRHWKLDPRLKDILFVVYTATYTEAEDERLALSLGADAFILKPAEPDVFLARLVEVQGNKMKARPTPPRHHAGNENEMLKVYSETLIRKLEEKMLQLEEANGALQRDIEERRRAEENLRESEERFRATFEQAAAGIAHVSPDGHFLRVNDKLCEITGYAREELLALGFADLSVPEDRTSGDEARRAILDGTKTFYTAEKRYRRKDGRVFWVSIVTSLLRDTAGEPKYFISVFSDITERKLLEEKLFRSQRMESIGTLAGGVAHDLNNILTPILLAVDLLKLQTSDNKSARMLETIRLSARRGTDLVRQVLSFARGVKGERVPANLGHIVREMESIIVNAFPKGIALQVEIPADLWLVTGDPSQLNQVVLNLCVNARDAMGDRGRLVVRARNSGIDAQAAAKHRGMEPGRYVVLEVKDTGCGIPADVMDKIFEPFFTTKETGKGTGLGLSTVLGIVRSHSGFMEVESPPGEGSLFRLFFPAQTETRVGPVLPRSDVELPRGRGEVILLVDDEAAVREIARFTLESFGYRVIVAEDGAQAISLHKVHQEKISLVLTDMMMPHMDGIALAGALHRINPALPVIVAGGVKSDEDVARALAAGISHVVPKPYSAEVLLSKVSEVLLATVPARRPENAPL